MSFLNKKKMLSRLIYIEIFLFVMVTLVTVVVLEKQKQTNEDLKLAVHFRHTSYLLSNELRQYSDDLTRMARTYIITGDEFYHKLFYLIRDIRNGTASRPDKYNQLIWDTVTVRQMFPNDNLVTGSSLLERIQQAGVSDKDLKTLIEADEISKQLIRFEEAAMEIMIGWFNDEDGNLTIRKLPNRQLAIDTMFSGEYHSLKRDMLGLLNGFVQTNDDRAFYTLMKAQENNGRLSITLMGLFISFVLLVPLLIFTISHKIKMSDAKIKKSGERYQFVATQPKQMIYDYNLKTKDFNWSGDIEGVTGYPKEQFQSISLDKWKLLIHLEDREDAVENFEKSIVEGGNYLSGYRLMHFTGGYRHLEVTGSFVLNNKNERIQMLGIVRDITERIEVEEEKVRLVEQLSHRNKMDAIGQLAGGIAHDFNNMLSGIMGAASLLGNPKYNLPEKCLDWVKLIQTSSERAADLTAKLLAFGRKSKLTSTPVNLHAILDDTVSLLESTIDKAIEITILKEANDFVTAGDDSDLQNAFLNICINASHAMKAGGEITIITRNIYLDNAFKELRNFDLTQGKYVEIEFRDTGCGIPVENKDKIFDPFYTTKENGEGSGLGLAAVYGTIQEHHGAIFVDSEVGVGTVFHIVLPFVKEYKRIAQRDGALVKGAGLILLVDDEEIIRITGKFMLEDMGYTVILAKDGSEAVDIFKARHSEITLVLMDMIMPVMNGREAFYELKKVQESCNVILSSGFTNSEKLDGLNNDGLAGFIQKPYRDIELSQVIDKAIQRVPR